MTNLDLSIQSLKEYTLRMIEKCEDAVDLSIEYTLKKDIRGLKKLIRQDDDIDILREYIRDRSIELMALKQPLARDLRYIYALSDISTELERIGDYSTNICKESLEIGEDTFIKEMIDIPAMKEICVEMLKNLWDALKNDDAELAFNIAQKDNEIDELLSLNYGADQYVTKPFNIQILLAKIAGLLRRNQNAEKSQEKIKCNEFILNVSKSVIEKENKKIELTKNELKILHYLVLNQGKIVTREEIMNYLWESENFIDDNTLTVNMTRLRGKLEELGIKDSIETKRGQGYILK